MGRCGENILLNELKERFGMLSFVSGFIVCNGIQSPQCDILVCRRNMYRRKLEGELYLVSPMDCLMTIEVKGNLTLTDIAETNRKNNFLKNMMKQAIFDLRYLHLRLVLERKHCILNSDITMKERLSHFIQVN